MDKPKNERAYKYWLDKLLTAKTEDENIIAVVIGLPETFYTIDDRHYFATGPLPVWIGQVLTWEEAQEYLKRFDLARAMPPLYAWTETRVLVISDHDGNLHIEAIPRNPTATMASYL